MLAALHKTPTATLPVALLSALLGAGCADGSGTACRVGADCASGVCRSDGTCARPMPDAGTPVDAAAPTVDAHTPPPTDTGPATDSGARVCAPDRDGTITRAEVPLRAGLYATFRIAEDAVVSTAGVTMGGARRWDLSGALTGDRDERVELRAPAGAWWAGAFPLATYATELSASSENLGVFEVREDALLLLGVVSPESGLTQTRLTYDPPVPVLRFPLREGDAWTVTSTVSGQALGAVTAYTEEYTFVADASGTIATPFGEVAVIRVRSELERTQGLVPLDARRSFAFVSECLGTVATVTSRSFETDAEFTAASEVRRLAP
ncbi:MAG: hypothetical protein OHK0013_22590 [Sandaracinaceae bacterium]